jgi:hypothetical protein
MRQEGFRRSEGRLSGHRVQFADPQRMTERHQDQQPVADRIAAVTGGGHQLVDFGFRQVLALPVIGVLGTTAANCRLSDCEARNWITVFIGQIPPFGMKLSI